MALFHKKVAKLKDEPTAPSKRQLPKRLMPGDVVDDEFALFDEEEAPKSKSKKVENSMEVTSFLRKFSDVLPVNPFDQFDFLMEAHKRNIIQLMYVGSRSNSSYKIQFKDLAPVSDPMSFVEFLDVFYSMSNLSKQIGIVPKDFPALAVGKCTDWFPEEALVKEMHEAEPSDAYFLMYTAATFVFEGAAQKIELPSFKRFMPVASFLQFARNIEQRDHPFIKKGYWLVVKDMFDDGLNISPSAQLIDLIMPNSKTAGSTKHFKGYSLASPNQIQTVHLHYSDETNKQLDRLKVILQSCPDELWDSRRLGVLLAGESGCGKSEFVVQVAKELGYHVMRVENLNNKYVGETEANIRRIFEVAYPRHRKELNGKVILCIDEFDQIAGKKSSVDSSNAFHTNAGISQLLKSLDGFKGIMMATLNESDERVEPAILRRFQMLIPFSLPSMAARKLIWASRDGFWQGNDVLLDRLASIPLSGSDIQSICEKGFFLHFAGVELAEATLFELVEEQVALGKKTRYQQSSGSMIGFQNKLAS